MTPVMSVANDAAAFRGREAGEADPKADALNLSKPTGPGEPDVIVVALPLAGVAPYPRDHERARCFRTFRSESLELGCMEPVRTYRSIRFQYSSER